MLLLLSPAKTLDFSPLTVPLQDTTPEFLDEAGQLTDILRAYTPDKLSSMMHISMDLAELNYERFLEWAPDQHRFAGTADVKQACMAFRGDVYRGLAAEEFGEQEFSYAQEHLRILSGLYGVLRPLDLVRPYRLEMGTRLATSHGRNLYEFWGDKIALALKEAAIDGVLVNLASLEYFKSVRLKDMNLEVYTPVFKDLRGKDYKIISFYAKRARGAMASWVIRNRIDDPEQLWDFEWDGYRVSQGLSTQNSPVFVRDR